MSSEVYYYLIMIATLLFTFGFVPIVLDGIKLPLTALICFLLSFLIYLFISFIKKYYIHSVFYIIGLLAIMTLIFISKK